MWDKKSKRSSKLSIFRVQQKIGKFFKSFLLFSHVEHRPKLSAVIPPLAICNALFHTLKIKHLPKKKFKVLFRDFDSQEHIF